MRNCKIIIWRSVPTSLDVLVHVKNLIQNYSLLNSRLPCPTEQSPSLRKWGPVDWSTIIIADIKCDILPEPFWTHTNLAVQTSGSGKGLCSEVLMSWTFRLNPRYEWATWPVGQFYYLEGRLAIVSVASFVRSRYERSSSLRRENRGRRRKAESPSLSRTSLDGCEFAHRLGSEERR